MQTSLNTTQQGSWHRKSASGYHKAGARGKSVEHCFYRASSGLVSSFKAGGPRTFESTVLKSR